MDALSSFAFNINNELLTSASRILDNYVVFALIVITLVLVAEKRNPKRVKIFSALLLATVFAVIIKSAIGMERPCTSMGLDGCPSDYSFPSVHAAVAFTLMVSFLDKKSYWFFTLFALFVSFTRLVLAAHSFIDIAGALPVALITYYMVDVLWRRFF
ncbi:phosphatase PAP2 family protein [Candidatus Micrarchaeota archaeon]|nr:phosphatase PAP2 family protein [Candidatus Micrarchaeota archaeon]